MDWYDVLFPIAKEVIDLLVKVVLIPAIVLGVKWVKDLLKDRLVRQIVMDGILYAQQLYWQEGGDVKFNEAIDYIVRQLNRWGIKMTEEDLIDLIEPLLLDLKLAVGDAWNEGEELEDF